jgi:type IV secretion system protein VirB4
MLRSLDHPLRHAGACATEIALSRFISKTVFETELGDLGLILSLIGIDPDCRTDEALNVFTRRFESAIRLFDDRFRVYSYIVKRSGAVAPSNGTYPTQEAAEAVRRRVDALRARAGSLYEIRLYMAVLYEGFRPQSRFFSAVNTAALDVAIEAERAVETLLGAVRSFQELVRDALPTQLLAEREARQFLRGLFNYDPDHAAAFHCGADLSYTTLDSQVDIHWDHLQVNEYAVKAVGLKALPASTRPNLLQELLAIPCDFIVCSEWKAQSNLRMRRLIRSKQTSFDALLVNLVALAVHGRGVPKSELPRKHEVEAHYDSLGECMKEIENRGNYFGAFSCTVILLGRSLQCVRESFSSVVKVFGRYDASVMDERLNLWHAWLSILPGNYQHSHRYHYLLNTNYADMAVIWCSYTGQKRNGHLRDEYLATFETADQQVFYFNAHVGGVMGVEITGAPEAGKSFLTNYLVAQAQKYKPATLILDLGRSYQDLTFQFGGSYFEISLASQEAQINPFSLAPSVDNRQFLFYFVRLLLGKDPGASLEEQAAEDTHIHEAVDAVYGLSPKDRRLQNLSLPAKLYARLARWCAGGQYGHLFDNTRDTVKFSHFTTFEFQGMEKHLDALTPLLFYITRRFDSIVFDPTEISRLKLLVMDECWRWMLMSEMSSYMIDKIKTGRKHNLGNVFVTQSGLDAERAGFGELLAEACPMKIFLANPAIKQETYQKLFGLNEKQAARIVSQRPRRDLTISTAQYFKTVELCIDDERDRLTFSNDPNSNLEKQLRREQRLAAHA